jgi:hypothetical protein
LGPNTKLGISVVAVWHITDHYGQLVAYLRLNGIVPPFTQKYGLKVRWIVWRRLSDFPILRNPRFVRSRVADDSAIGAPKQITSFLRWIGLSSKEQSVGATLMAANQVVLYFEKPEDALLFTLAASSVMSAEGAVHSSKAAVRVAQEICKANRITTKGALNITWRAAN